MICQRSSGVWPRVLSYLAWPFMKPRKYGRSQMSCDRLTMPLGLYWKASNSSEQYPHWSHQRLWDWWAHMTWKPFATSMAWLTAPGTGRRARIRGQSSTTFEQCTTGLDWCATNVTTTHQPQWTPSTTMAGRTVNPRERETPMSQPHQSNCQQKTSRLNWESEQRGWGELDFPQAALSGTPPPISRALEGNQMEKVPPTNPQHPITCFPAPRNQVAICYSRITQDVHQQCWTQDWKLTTLRVGRIKNQQC